MYLLREFFLQLKKKIPNDFDTICITPSTHGEMLDILLNTDTPPVSSICSIAGIAVVVSEMVLPKHILFTRDSELVGILVYEDLL